MKKKWIAAAVLAVAAGFAAAAAGAAVKNLSQQDKTWLKKAHQSNLAEIQMGKMAKRNGHAKDVRLAGDTLLTDHTMLDGQLKSAAYQLGVALPASPTHKQQSEAQALSSKTGLKFDKAWTQKMIKGHQKAIAMTKQEISKGKSPAVERLAKDTLPVLQKHLNLLQGTADQ